MDNRNKNNIFSYFFYINSPSFRIIIDGLIFMLFFILTLENNFKLIRIYQGFMNFGNLYKFHNKFNFFLNNLIMT
jgi:hypothetical protein